MNCVEFGFDRSRGFGIAWGQIWPIAIDRPTRPCNIASTTVQQVIPWESYPRKTPHFGDVNGDFRLKR
jgi:hypothetical protein